MKTIDFSIIILVLNEMDIINEAVSCLINLKTDKKYEIIIVDGDKEGRTIKKIRNKGIKKIIAGRSRGKQLNAGAHLANGEILIFLHADTRLPWNALERISSVMKNKKYSGGAFELSLDSGRFFLKITSLAATLRSRISRIPYGDQAIFIRKNFFTQIGGFKNIPIMEDVELMKRIKKMKKHIIILKDKVKSSPRRWEQEGMFYYSLKNKIVSILYFFGVSPDKLERFYNKKIRN